MKNLLIPWTAACLTALAASASAQSTGPTQPAPQPSDPSGASHGAIVDKTPEGMDRARPHRLPETDRRDRRSDRPRGADERPDARQDARQRGEADTPEGEFDRRRLP